MTVYLQDPGATEGYLLEALLDAASSADGGGGGSFAFATASGVDILLGDRTFADLARRYPFDLVVGVDAVTDTNALEALARYDRDLAGLTVRAFVHDLRPILFHPKYSWFRRGSRLRLISGSGNLTRGGLRGNWETFTVAEYAGRRARSLSAQLLDWRAKWAECLRPLNDPVVVSRAARNTGREEFDLTTGRVETPPPVADDAAVLIAEIPRGGTRWNQANFDLENYEDFFGMEVGTERRILLQHVKPDGSLDEVESRVGVAVRSRNFRVELGAARHLSYPAAGRPTAVFLRNPDGTFLYELVMPSSPLHERLARFLSEKTSVPAGRMKRLPTTAGTLRSALSDLPIWRASSRETD